MLRRVNQIAVGRMASQRLTASASRNVHVKIVDGLPQGTVVRRTFDHERPKYTPSGYVESMIFFHVWFQANYGPLLVMCFAFVWAIHGGFTGHLPPNPHDLWN